MSAHFGLDIGSYSIKLIEAKKRGNEYQLISFGEVAMPADINSEADKDKVAITETIKKLASDCKVSSQNVALALPETSVYSQVIELPYLSSNELASAISFEAEQYIPVPLEEVQLEYLVLKTPPKGAIEEKMEVLLIGAKKVYLEKLVDLVTKAGLVPVSAETEVLSLMRNLTLNPKRAGIILDLGYRSSDMILIDEQKLKLVRTLPTGGEAITRAIADAFNMDTLQAEQYKVSYGIDPNQLEGKLANIILPMFSVIITEVKRGIVFYQQKKPDKNIDYIIISGGGAEMSGLSAYIAKNLNLEVLMADPFANFIKNEKFPNIIGKPRFSIAVGLAIREND